MLRARGPTSAATRSFISPAALLVKVIARISPGDTSRSAIRYATRCVSTRVLPEPAPATISNGPPCVHDRRALLRIQPVQQGRRIDRQPRTRPGQGGIRRQVEQLLDVVGHVGASVRPGTVSADRGTIRTFRTLRWWVPG